MILVKKTRINADPTAPVLSKATPSDVFAT